MPFELADKSLSAPEKTSPQTVPAEALAKASNEIGTSSVDLDSFAEKAHSYVWENVVLADQKAGFLFAGLAATLAYLHEKGISRIWLTSPKTWELENWLAFLAVAGLIAGAMLALFVVLPRFSGAKRGVVYWKAIAGFQDAAEYTYQVRRLGQDDLHDAVLCHCFELARIAKRKLGLFHLALWLGGVGLLSALLHLALFPTSPTT